MTNDHMEKKCQDHIHTNFKQEDILEGKTKETGCNTLCITWSKRIHNSIPMHAEIWEVIYKRSQATAATGNYFACKNTTHQSNNEVFITCVERKKGKNTTSLKITQQTLGQWSLTSGLESIL